MATNRKGYMKEWFKQFDGYYVYVIKDLDNNIVYSGKTLNYYHRIQNHICGNVPSTKEFIKQGNYIIQYLNITNEIKSDNELSYLENIILELYEPPLNDVKNIIKGLDKFRMLELVSIIHSFSASWNTYCVCRNGENKRKLK